MQFNTILKILCILSMDSLANAKIKLEDYAKLIIKVFDHNKESSITIFHYSENDDFIEKQYLLKITNLLSKREIVSVTADFRDWGKMRKHYWEKNKEQIHGRRPMIVILLADEKSLNQFRRMCVELNSEEQLFFLVLFVKTDKEYLTEFCENPDRDFFKIRLDAFMVVKCYDNDRLYGWYTLSGASMEVSTWAIWDPQIEFLTMILDHRHRRIDLQGRVLKIGTVESSALTSWTEDNVLDGFFGQLLHELQICMNFTWELVAKEREYGSWNDTGHYWTGATKLLYEKKIDLLVTDLALTSLRMTAIDYTIPLLNVYSLLYVKKPQSGTVVKWLGYFKFFDVRIWIALIIVILITPLILTLMKMKIRESYILSLLLMENYLNIWGIYCQQGLLEFPSTTSLRIVYFSIFVSALIILNYYSAILISRLTYPIPSVYLPDMKAFVDDGTFKLITLKNGADYNIFEYGKTPILQAMFKLMMTTEDLPESVQKAFDMVCEQKVGFFVVETARKIHDLHIKCDLHEINTNLLEISAMAMPKHSEYKSEINRNFFTFEVNGMLKRFYEQYFYHETVPDEPKSQVTIWEIVILLSIVAAGIVVSIFILLAEIKINFLHKLTTVKKADRHKHNFFKKFKTHPINLHHFNHNGPPNIKFTKNNREYKIVLSPGVNKISFQF